MLFMRALVFSAALTLRVTTKTSSCMDQLLWRREKLGRYLLLITTFLQVSTKAQVVHTQGKSMYHLLFHPKIWFTDLQLGKIHTHKIYFTRAEVSDTKPLIILIFMLKYITVVINTGRQIHWHWVQIQMGNNPKVSKAWDFAFQHHERPGVG